MWLNAAVMKLHAYLLSLPVHERVLFASRVGTSLAYVNKLAYNFDSGVRPSAEIAAQIEAASNRKVRRWECIPEKWHRIWPELLGDPEAPLPPLPTCRQATPLPVGAAANDPTQESAA